MPPSSQENAPNSVQFSHDIANVCPLSWQIYRTRNSYLHNWNQALQNFVISNTLHPIRGISTCLLDFSQKYGINNLHHTVRQRHFNILVQVQPLFERAISWRLSGKYLQQQDAVAVHIPISWHLVSDTVL